MCVDIFIVEGGSRVTGVDGGWFEGGGNDISRSTSDFVPHLFYGSMIGIL